MKNKIKQNSAYIFRISIKKVFLLINLHVYGEYNYVLKEPLFTTSNVI